MFCESSPGWASLCRAPAKALGVSQNIMFYKSSIALWGSWRSFEPLPCQGFVYLTKHRMLQKSSPCPRDLSSRAPAKVLCISQKRVYRGFIRV